MTLPYITIPISSVSETLSRLTWMKKNTSRGFWARHLSRFLFDHLFSLFQASAHHGGVRREPWKPLCRWTFFELMDCITVKWMATLWSTCVAWPWRFDAIRIMAIRRSKTWRIKTTSDLRIYRKIYPPFSKKSSNQSNERWQILRLHLGSSCLGLRLSMTGGGSNEGWIGPMTIELGFSHMGMDQYLLIHF